MKEQMIMWNRIFYDEDEGETIRCKTFLGISEVQYIEEYTGSKLPVEYDISILRLYSGETVCVIANFDKLAEDFKKFKESLPINYLNNQKNESKRTFYSSY